jgi:tetratricopeptide (TPR) repeat protein
LVAGAASLVIVGTIALAIGTILLGQANRRVQVERDVASRQRDLARENFEKARQAVDVLLTSVSEEQLLNQPGLQPLRKKLLGSALDYYQDFVRQRADDPTLRRQLAEAYRRLGEINGGLGKLSEAIAALEQAVTIFEPLRAASPTDIELSIAPARALQALAYYHLRRDEDVQGERGARSAIELLEPLERDHPENPEYGRRLGRCYDLLGVVGLVRNRPTQNLPYWDKAVAVLERTLVRHPGELEARAFLVKALDNRTSGQEGLDDYEAALPSARRAVDLAQKLRELSPDDPTFRFDFAMSLVFRNEREINLGLFQSGERSGSAAVELLRSLSGASPSMASYRSWLFRGLTFRARALVQLGQVAKTDLTIREAQSVLSSMGTEARLDQFERQINSQLEEVRGTRLAEQERFTERARILESNVLRREAQFNKGHDEWTILRELIESKTSFIEARLRAGLISLPFATRSLTQLLTETEADSRRLDQPSIRFARAEVLVRQAALQAEGGDFTESLSTLERAFAALETESASHLQRLHWKLVLARAVALRSDLHRRANRPAQALDDARRAVELVEPTIGEGSGYLYELGAFQTAYHDLALKLGSSQSKFAPPDLQTCLDTLKKAVSAGFDNTARLRKDPRLELLRQRKKAEFDGLVASTTTARIKDAAATAPPVSATPSTEGRR